ncbi:hypothetical protein F2Q65_01355 [Thiohalocapsa marina]|uniref:SRPBCC domain-containing protein n=1 Tax=Thiohalocapsa marina TaxID=424902 RepID=A0A5M8FVS7_9GAMM|nr:hypothetical protein [Thiohalocapsa marina]KAA6187906.1 hypothetical protein F2Q65_01355 [Thiohalocapsa marina]
MEFFATVRCSLSPSLLQDHISGPRLAEVCASIDRVLNWSDDQGEVYCLWGQFLVRREVIRAGLRFTLPHCPNALAWTLTAEPDGVLIHCTINRATHEPDFIESIETFVQDWRQGLEMLGHGHAASATRA